MVRVRRLFLTPIRVCPWLWHCARPVSDFMAAHDEPPKLILLENHGMIALGDTPAEILNITAMTVKAARIFLGALMTGQPRHLPDDEVWHVVRRPDEIYRRRLFAADSD